MWMLPLFLHINQKSDDDDDDDDEEEDDVLRILKYKQHYIPKDNLGPAEPGHALSLQTEANWSGSAQFVI